MSIFAKRNHQNIKIMTKEELIDRINDIEWEDFEAKEAKSELPKNIWETVSEFANTSGGWIVLGIKQNGKKFEISGVDNAEKLEQDFQDTLRSQKFNEAVNAKSMLYHIDGHRFFWMDLVEIPGRSVREARTRYTYRIPEQENLWEYFQIMIRRLRLIVDTPFMMNDEGFNVEDRSQFKILREALVNMLSHFDPFSTIHSCINIYTNRVNDRVINNNEIYDILNSLSMDYDRYRHMKSVLRLYRLTMGQPRQEELLEFFKDMPAEDIDKLLFNLSPIKRKK